MRLCGTFCVGADTGATFFISFFSRNASMYAPLFFVHKGGETGVSYSLSLSLSRKSGYVGYLFSWAEGGDLNGAKCFRLLSPAI